MQIGHLAAISARGPGFWFRASRTASSRHARCYSPQLHVTTMWIICQAHQSDRSARVPPSTTERGVPLND